MKHSLKTISQRYLVALRQHFDQGTPATLRLATRFGRDSFALGLQVPALAKIHQQCALQLLSSGDKSPSLTFERTHKFLIQTLLSNKDCFAALSNGKKPPLKSINQAGEIALLTTEISRLNRVAARRDDREKRLHESRAVDKASYRSLLAQSQVARNQLRRLSHNILSVQEEERKEISRELHDEIAQNLAGISLHLSALKDAATINTLAFKKKIDQTQLFVERSVNIVHQFARELRPPLLDDLGLIPALESRINTFIERTGLSVNFTATPSVEKLSNTKRTVFYRVAQEALTNVARHAKASKVVVLLKSVPGFIQMEIKDNGNAFNVEHIFSTQRNRRLGLIGMRERVEMSGGKFRVESVPGQGTTVFARIPFNRNRSA